MRDLTGCVVLLTGATEGIGKAAAAEFAARGATLTIVGRDSGKGEQTAKLLQDTTGNEDIYCLTGDLSKIADILGVVNKFRATHGRLDILVNNAGAIFNQYSLTVDGLEKTFALNHLAYFGLTTQLLDLITRTPGARVVSTGKQWAQDG